MPDLLGSSLAGIAVAVGGVLAAVLLVLRYRALVRAGTPLPPGAGGARLRGLETTVVEPHRPGRDAGVVHVLGDDWSIADEVDVELERGRRVRVVAVVGTRLVVEPVEPPARGPASAASTSATAGADGPSARRGRAPTSPDTVPPEHGSASWPS